MFTETVKAVIFPLLFLAEIVIILIVSILINCWGYFENA